MKKISLVLTVILILLFSMPSFSKVRTYSSWDGYFTIEDNHSYLLIQRKYTLTKTRPNPGGIKIMDDLYTTKSSGWFNYRIPCNSNIRFVEELSFQESYSDTKIYKISLDDGVRHNPHTSDLNRIRSFITSQKINLHSYGDDYGSLELTGIKTFMDKHKQKISECRNSLQKGIDKEKTKKYIFWAAYGVAFIIGFALIIFIFKFTPKKIRSTTSKTKDLSKNVTKNISKRSNERASKNLHKKAIESAVDEIVRQAVRQAMSEGVDPNEIVICSNCKGAGCSECSNKGWIIEE